MGKVSDCDAVQAIQHLLQTVYVKTDQGGNAMGVYYQHRFPASQCRYQIDLLSYYAEADAREGIKVLLMLGMVVLDRPAVRVSREEPHLLYASGSKRS